MKSKGDFLAWHKALIITVGDDGLQTHESNKRGDKADSD